MTHDAPSPLPEDLVPLMQAHTRAEALVVASLLTSAGIPSYVDGRKLMDEFAISQALMGLKSEIRVHPSDLARARLLLDEARKEGTELKARDPGTAHGAEHGGRGTGHAPHAH